MPLENKDVSSVWCIVCCLSGGSRLWVPRHVSGLKLCATPRCFLAKDDSLRPGPGLTRGHSVMHHLFGETWFIQITLRCRDLRSEAACAAVAPVVELYKIDRPLLKVLDGAIPGNSKAGADVLTL